MLRAIPSKDHVAKVSSEFKRMARRTRKKTAKQKRDLIFTFGSLVFVLLTGKFLGTCVSVLKVSLHLLLLAKKEPPPPIQGFSVYWGTAFPPPTNRSC